MILGPDFSAERERGVGDDFFHETGYRFDLEGSVPPDIRIQSIGSRPDRTAEASSTSETRELTPAEERDVDNGWTTPAAIRARDTR